MSSLMTQLKSLVNQVDDGCAPCCSPCGPCCAPSCPPCCPGVGCPPCPYPYAQVCMLTPPPCIAPTQPKYVKPLQLPCPPGQGNSTRRRDPEEEFRNRTANFYNNYNIDYHNPGLDKCKKKTHSSNNCGGQTVDGKKPHCEDYTARNRDCDDDPEGCPTGFKPCSMKLCPPPCCDVLGIWKAEIQPCPPKPVKRVSKKYVPGPCTRPCCKHWKPKGGPCLYDKPCKAHCYDHPPGIKASNDPCSA